MQRLCTCLLLISGCGAPRLPEGLPPPEYERPVPRAASTSAGGGFGGMASGESNVATAPGGAGAGALPAGGSAGSGP